MEIQTLKSTKSEFSQDKRYLNLLSQSFPTVADASREIINLQAILNLPKSTEHFVADLHGENEAFQHILKNASGNIKRKVNNIFGNTLRESEKRELCTLIYYPEQKLELIKQEEEEINDWYHITIYQLVRVCRDVSSKYTRSKVHKTLPEEFSYIIQELLHERTDDEDKTDYVTAIIDTIISTGRADDFICAICNVIQRLSIAKLHVLGDIFDRGPGAHLIMDTLIPYHKWDIQWGNHDILWMGASAGNDACICNVLRIALRYANMKSIEDGYGINLVPLATFAMEVYANDPCKEFQPRLMGEDSMSDKAKMLYAQMHKAITVIQLKREAQIFHSHPSWKMEDRDMLSVIDYEHGTCTLMGKTYNMSSCHFPTIDPQNPTALTPEEEALMRGLRNSFLISEKLHRHIRKILSHGCMFAICNSNLLFHASIPLNADGTLREVEIMPGQRYKGKELMHNIGMMIRSAFQNDTPKDEHSYARDYFLYLWCGPDSPLFDKSKMATFERYFLKEKETHIEEKGNYFKLRHEEHIIDMILDAFEVKGENRHVINGHVPVHVVKGESPVRANGKLMVIDGGFSQPYHKETGIAGYTLVYHSRGFELVQHEPFNSTADAIKRGIDIKSTRQILEMSHRRMRVADTDEGAEISSKIADLKDLLYAYRHGIITERERKKEFIL
ncbi:MAG: fructose-1,6-bisphosphatase [Prevotella sp.]|nr:fructose-1,6-bisphosphatase [Prevotella sp.]